MITLHGGPCNGIILDDIGTVQIKKSIYKYKGCISLLPINNALAGFSIYEIDEDRKNAFFLSTTWDGKVIF